MLKRGIIILALVATVVLPFVLRPRQPSPEQFEIQHFGLSRVGCKELKLLCSNVSATDEKIGIEQIAEWERWTFEYLPDGSVQFTSLPANTSIPVVSP